MATTVEVESIGVRWIDLNKRWIDIDKRWIDLRIYFLYKLLSTETIEVSEDIKKEVDKELSSDLEVKDDTGKGIDIAFTEEAIEFEDSVEKMADKISNEGFDIKEQLEKVADKTTNESFNLEDAIEKEVNKLDSETFDIEDSVEKMAGKVANESFNLKEMLEKWVEKPFSSELTVEDVVSKIYSLNKSELLDIITNFLRVVQYKRLWAESFDLKEVVAKLSGKTKKELIEILTLYLRNADTIISDLNVYGKAFNETDFDHLLTPTGYERFKEMVTGDYLYEKALCKVVLEATANSDRPNVREYVHNVDVPDTYDSGFITFTPTNQPVYKLFSRPFKVVPDLRLTLKSADTSVDLNWLALSVTTEGFTAQLKSSDTYTGGKLSYSARGY